MAEVKRSCTNGGRKLGSLRWWERKVGDIHHKQRQENESRSRVAKFHRHSFNSVSVAENGECRSQHSKCSDTAQHDFCGMVRKAGHDELLGFNLVKEGWVEGLVCVDDVSHCLNGLGMCLTHVMSQQ